MLALLYLDGVHDVRVVIVGNDCGARLVAGLHHHVGKAAAVSQSHRTLRVICRCVGNLKSGSIK